MKVAIIISIVLALTISAEGRFLSKRESNDTQQGSLAGNAIRGFGGIIGGLRQDGKNASEIEKAIDSAVNGSASLADQVTGGLGGVSSLSGGLGGLGSGLGGGLFRRRRESSNSSLAGDAIRGFGGIISGLRQDGQNASQIEQALDSAVNGSASLADQVTGGLGGISNLSGGLGGLGNGLGGGLFRRRRQSESSNATTTESSNSTSTESSNSTSTESSDSTSSDSSPVGDLIRQFGSTVSSFRPSGSNETDVERTFDSAVSNTASLADKVTSGLTGIFSLPIQQ